jgi:hypothetical protein
MKFPHLAAEPAEPTGRKRCLIDTTQYCAIRPRQLAEQRVELRIGLQDFETREINKEYRPRPSREENHGKQQVHSAFGTQYRLPVFSDLPVGVRIRHWLWMQPVQKVRISRRHLSICQGSELYHNT